LSLTLMLRSSARSSHNDEGKPDDRRPDRVPAVVRPPDDSAARRPRRAAAAAAREGYRLEPPPPPPALDHRSPQKPGAADAASRTKAQLKKEKAVAVLRVNPTITSEGPAVVLSSESTRNLLAVSYLPQMCARLRSRRAAQHRLEGSLGWAVCRGSRGRDRSVGAARGRSRAGRPAVHLGLHAPLRQTVSDYNSLTSAPNR
jgi:hypothetical protein